MLFVALCALAVYSVLRAFSLNLAAAASATAIMVTGYVKLDRDNALRDLSLANFQRSWLFAMFVVVVTAVVYLGLLFGFAKRLSFARPLAALDQGMVQLVAGATTLGSVVVEEIFFRGVLLRLLSSRFGLLLGVLLQAALFTLFHWYVPFGLGDYRWLQVFILGLVYALLFLHSGSLVAAMLFHFAWNVGVAVAVTHFPIYEYLPIPGAAKWSDHVAMALIAGITAFVVAAGWYFRSHSFREFVREKRIFS
ncbi:MAG: CPBP family intramembrane metalloprotease [Betaproteobacteria bacterium]|nr:CPBP family intramembrane metalloprotease [Betaproteobacteria bacterium]